MRVKAEGAKNKQRLSYKWRSSKEALENLYPHFSTRDRVLITIDPDPDSIAAAVAVKRLLWHKVQSTTIGLIRPMNRLNNITLVRLLRLPIIVIKPSQFKDFDKFILVDGQPGHNDIFGSLPYTAIIDHHPVTQPIEASFVDIRPDYGATATILTRYLKAAKIKPPQTLATALIYGIKTDTRNFERHTLGEDIEAFRYLYNLVNHYMLRKIEISDLALKDLKFFQKALDRKHVVKDRVFTHLDEVPSADILVIIAEFLLKVHDISWSVASGIFEGRLVIIVRNDGYRKDAGRTISRAFGSIGCAGGHQALARAEIPMENLAQAVSEPTSIEIERFIRKRLSPFY